MTERDNDGIILYDSTDDFGEDRSEEIFTDDYMRAFADAEERKIVRMRRRDRLVSAAVIAGAVGYIALLCAIFF